jgi:4-amino-4-deoxy-L-arabinose transferase-like glycosyltransferase
MLNFIDHKVGVAVVVIAAIVWFAFLGHRDLFEEDEGRYAEIPREMVASGDWLTPRLDGFKYFEKPAFQYWITAAGYKLFGENNATARLWPAVFGFVCALFIGYLGGRLFNRDAGFYGFIITISSLMFVTLGHFLTLDMTVSAFMMIGIGAFAIAQNNRRDRACVRNWMLIAWAALAGAVLTKGLVGLVLPGAAVVVYGLWQRDYALWKHMHLFKGMLLLLILTVPWFWAVSDANAEFARFFFIHEHFERYISTVHKRTGSILYFVPVFILGVSPWLVSSLGAVFRPDLSWRSDPAEGFNSIRFFWVYIVLTFVFFSIAESKLPAYILPIMPVVALLAGKRLASKKVAVKGDAWSLLIIAGLCLILGIGITRFAIGNVSVEDLQRYRLWVIPAALSLFAGAVALFRAELKPGRNIAIAGISALCAFQMLLLGYQELERSRTSADIARAIQENNLVDVPIYSVDRDYPQSLPFYIGKTITLVGYRGELSMGIDAEPDKWLATPQQFQQRWQADAQAVAVFDDSGYQRYRAMGLPMRIIYQAPGKIVVAKSGHDREMKVYRAAAGIPAGGYD